jgi:hypothetical protein
MRFFNDPSSANPKFAKPWSTGRHLARIPNLIPNASRETTELREFD